MPYLHSKEFFDHIQARNNVRLRLLYDELLEHRTPLTLKERCWLKIKENLVRYPLDIQQLNNLPWTLQNYLAFDLYHPNFVQNLLKMFHQIQGHLKPSYFDELQFHEHSLEPINAHYDWEDQTVDEVDQLDEEDNDDMVTDLN